VRVPYMNSFLIKHKQFSQEAQMRNRVAAPRFGRAPDVAKMQNSA